MTFLQKNILRGELVGGRTSEAYVNEFFDLKSKGVSKFHSRQQFARWMNKPYIHDPRQVSVSGPLRVREVSQHICMSRGE